MLPLGRTHSYLSWKLTKGYWLVGSFCLICCVKISFKFCHHDCCEGTTSISPVLQLVICKVSCCTVCCGRRLCQYHRSVDFLKHFDLLDFNAAYIQAQELLHQTIAHSRHALRTGLPNRVVFVPTSTATSTHPIE